MNDPGEIFNFYYVGSMFCLHNKDTMMTSRTIYMYVTCRRISFSGS